MRQLPATDSRSWKQKRGTSAPASSHACKQREMIRNLDLFSVDFQLCHRRLNPVFSFADAANKLFLQHYHCQADLRLPTSMSPKFSVAVPDPEPASHSRGPCPSADRPSSRPIARPELISSCGPVRLSPARPSRPARCGRRSRAGRRSGHLLVGPGAISAKRRMPMPFSTCSSFGPMPEIRFRSSAFASTTRSRLLPSRAGFGWLTGSAADRRCDSQSSACLHSAPACVGALTAGRLFSAPDIEPRRQLVRRRVVEGAGDLAGRLQAPGRRRT